MATRSDEEGTTPHARTAIETLAWLIHEAFEGDHEQSLLANLGGLRDEDWTAQPPGGERTVADILMRA